MSNKQYKNHLVSSKNLVSESQTKTKFLFHETKYCFLKQNTVSKKFQKFQKSFRKRNFCFRKSKSFLLKLDEFFCQRKELIPFDVHSFVYDVKIFQ